MKRRGFTLLEVLVAISILGLALTVILSSEVGLFSSSQRARNLSLATGLARCKTSEVEAKLLKEGYPLTDQTEQGSCCEEELTLTFQCSWKIQKIELPESAAMGKDGGGDNSIGDGGPLSALLDLKQNPGSALDGGLANIGNAFGEAGVGGVAPLLMDFIYPTLKPMLEASIRKLTITVAWKEGITEKKLEIVEFVTDPQQGGLDPNAALLANRIAGAANTAMGLGQSTTSPATVGQTTTTTPATTR